MRETSGAHYEQYGRNIQNLSYEQKLFSLPPGVLRLSQFECAYKKR
jgi:hypothetical protein